MKKLIFSLITVLAITIISVNAQEIKLKIPATSLGQQIEQDFGLGEISVKYYRPNTLGRKIYNGMEPYGVVWRTGANNATVIKFTDTVKIEGHLILPGSYSLFTIPDASEFTIILNKNIDQWGAYTYDQKQDLIRFKVKTVKLPARIETLTIQFADVHQEDCLMQINWENTGINIHLTADVDNRILANIQEAMKGEKKPYYTAALWCYHHNRNLPQALSWIEEANKPEKKTYNRKYWLAMLQLKNGDKKSAVVSANEGLKLALAENNAEYIRLNNEVLKEASK